MTLLPFIRDSQRTMEKNAKCPMRIEDLEVDKIADLMKKWGLEEFVDLAHERALDGRKLLDITEGLVKLWRPKVNAKKLIIFVEDFKSNPGKYLKEDKELDEISSIECQYQTVKKTKVEVAATTASSVEELFKKLVPPKSFLYRNHVRRTDKTVPSYLPMDGGTRKVPKKFFRLSSYEYPHFDFLTRFSKQEIAEDRGYYSVKTNSRYHIQKTSKKSESRTKYKSLSSAEEIEKNPEEHFYEDLCYNDIASNDNKISNTLNQTTNVKPCFVKLHELFHSFKMPFFKRVEEVVERDKNVDKDIENVTKESNIRSNIYENGELCGNMYDSVQVMERTSETEHIGTAEKTMPVEDYLEPVQLQINKDYCDVNVKQKEESLLGYILNLFENRFGIRRETNDPDQSEASDNEAEKKQDIEDGSHLDTTTDDKMAAKRHNMADRPLPVPVENEPYYMNIDRAEAENLLKGQPDGAFVLRPSSQSNHAYTLSVSCSNAVHNVGIRRRPDGRLALGFARRGERSFASVPSMLRHHKRRRLLLVAAGGVLGSTTLNDTPQYYQTPTSLPLAMS